MQLSTVIFDFESEHELEDILNRMFMDLKKFQKYNPDFKFKMKVEGSVLEVKTVKLNESVN